MIIWAFNLMVLAIGILITGMFKPQLVLFWWEEREPSRLVIVVFCSLILMAAAIMYGEGNRQGEPLSKVAPAHLQQKAPVADKINTAIASPADLVKD